MILVIICLRHLLYELQKQYSDILMREVKQCFARVYRDRKEFAHIVGDSTSVITRYKSHNDVPDVLP